MPQGFSTRAVLLLILLCSALMRAQAAEPLTAALLPDPALGLADSAPFHLLEVDLSKDPRLALLERAEINKVVSEQALQLAFAAEGLTARRRLGELLKARMLIILRQQEKEVGPDRVQSLEMVIADSTSGLRVTQDRFLMDAAKPEDLVRQVHAAIDQARERMGRPITLIAAVPPFISDDFTYDYAAMKGAYAEVVRQSLLRRPGAVLVELEEARAIGEEMKVSGAHPLHRPQAPFYFLGRFGNTGRGEDRKVSLTLEVRQGEKEIHKKLAGALAPAQVAKFLQENVEAVSVRRSGAAPPAYNPEQELKDLSRRAAEFKRLGELNEALSLFEACLVLKPDSALFHRDALELCGDLTRAVLDGNMNDAFGHGSSETPVPKDKLALLIAYNTLALDHLEYYLRSDLIWEDARWPTWKLNKLLQGLWTCHFNEKQMSDPESRNLFAELRRRRREVIVSGMEQQAVKGKMDSEVVSSLGQDFLEQARWVAEDPERMLKEQYRVLKLLNTLPDSGYTMIKFIEWGEPHMDLSEGNPRHLKAYQEFLKEVERLRGEPIRYCLEFARLCKGYGYGFWGDDDTSRGLQKLDALAAEIRQKKDGLENLADGIRDEARHIREFRQTRQLARTDDPNATATIAYESVNDPALPAQIAGWIKCGPGVDLIWNAKEIYLMRGKGQTERIFRAEAKPAKIQRVVYDGKYAWAPVAGPEPLLLVIDPATGALDRFTAADGLPPATLGALPTPLAPASVCVVGSFGRAWCAVAGYGGPGRKSLKIVHEAALGGDDELNSHTAYVPRFVEAVHESPGKGAVRVLVARTIKSRSFCYPLLIDPATGSAKVLPQYWFSYFGDYFGGEGIAEDKGSLYFVERDLWRFGFPGFELEPLVRKLGSGGPLVIRDGCCYVFGERPWMTDLRQIKKIPLKGRGPGGFCVGQLGDSHHYGLITFNETGKVYRLILPKLPIAKT